MSLGYSCNIQLWKGKATGLLAKTTAMKGSPKVAQAVWCAMGRETHSFLVALVWFYLCFYAVNSEHRTFLLHSLTRGIGSGREAHRGWEGSRAGR